MLEYLSRAIELGYQRYAFDLLQIGRTSQGVLSLPDDDTILASIRSAAGRLGASVSAGVKREKRELVFAELIKAREMGLDLTMATVQKLAKSVLGRAFDNNQVQQIFGTPGRTAATRSAVTPAEFEALRQLLETEIALLESAIAHDLAAARERWFNSRERQAIMREWRSNRLADISFKL